MATNSANLRTKNKHDGYYGYYVLTSTFVENSINVSNNSSNITVTATLAGTTGTAFDVSNAGTLAIYWHDNKDQISILKDSITVNKCGNSSSYPPVTISKTFDATHKEDGTLKGYAVAVWTKSREGYDDLVPSLIYPYGENDTNCEIGTPLTDLTNIARASTPIASSNDVTIGNDLTITFNNYVSGFTYTLIASDSQSNSITLDTKTTNSYHTFNTLNDFNFYQFLGASDTSDTITFTLYTYNGNDLIGTNTCSITIKSNSNHIPNVSISSIDTGKVITDTTKTTLDLTGSNKRIINNWNTISATWSATIDNRYNTNIASISINGNNVSTSPTTLNDISNSISITATDARDNVKSLNESDLTFIPYEYPSIVPTIKRNTSTDGHVNLTFTGMFYNVDFGQEQNDLTLEWYVREKGTQNYTQGATALTYTENANNTSYVNSATISLVNPLDQVDGLFDYTKAYEFKFVATDLVTSYTISEVILTGGIPNFVVFKNAILSNGKRIDNILETIYPIGKVEIFYDNLDHSNFMGFTWQRVTNAYLYAGGGNVQTYGSNTTSDASNTNSGSTTLTASQSGLPSHYHSITTGGYSYNAGIAQGALSIATSDSTQPKDTSAWTNTADAGGSNATDGHTHTINHTHTVEPFRIEVAVWRRTA